VKEKNKNDMCWESLNLVSGLTFWKQSNCDLKWYVAMFLYQKKNKNSWAKRKINSSFKKFPKQGSPLRWNASQGVYQKLK